VGHLALAVVILAAVLAAGWATRTHAPPAAPAPPRASAELGALRLDVAPYWTAEPIASSGVRGLDERVTAAFAPVAGLRAHAVITLAPIEDATLVPHQLRALLAQPLPAPERTTLLGAAAWRYPAQPLSDDRLLEVTVAPTSAGVLAVACIGRDSSWMAASGCAEGVRWIALGGARRIAPAPDLALRRSAPAVLARLGQRRRGLRARLRAAPSRRARARVATRISAAYGRAASALAPVAPASGPAHELVAALGATRGAYRALALARAAGAPRRTLRARSAIVRGDARIDAALAGLR
jgi:hypothetical protein